MKAIDILKQAKLQNTYWGERISDAEHRGHFFSDDIYASKSWVTCACGKATHEVAFHENPEGEFVEPKDKELLELGKTFYDKVAAQDMEGAAYTLVAIEKRAAKLYTTSQPALRGN